MTHVSRARVEHQEKQQLAEVLRGMGRRPQSIDGHLLVWNHGAEPNKMIFSADSFASP
jgi:hypothetical protein